MASIHGARSPLARINTVLAAGLIGVLAVGFLGWYYTQLFERRSREVATPDAKAKAQVQAEMPLPPLGRVDPPMVEKLLGPAPEPPSASPWPAPASDAASALESASPHAGGRSHSAGPEPDERRLSGPVFVSMADERSKCREGDSRQDARFVDGNVAAGSRGEGHARGSALADLLQPTATPTAMAQMLPTQRLLLPKGAFLDCTLETAIDSSLPGMTTCVTATDTFSADGTVVLLERGTKLVGETRGDVRQGTARVFVVWTEARTPDGVVMPLASPGTDELGRSGLPGEVNRHFWERFGAAILVSVIDGAVQAAAQSANNGDGAVIVNPSSSRDVMTEVLRGTINISPTVVKRHGDRIAVLVARDLDFRSVYELRPTAVRR